MDARRVRTRAQGESGKPFSSRDTNAHQQVQTVTEFPNHYAGLNEASGVEPVLPTTEALESDSDLDLDFKEPRLDSISEMQLFDILWYSLLNLFTDVNKLAFRVRRLTSTSFEETDRDYQSLQIVYQLDTGLNGVVHQSQATLLLSLHKASVVRMSYFARIGNTTQQMPLQIVSCIVS